MTIRRRLSLNNVYESESGHIREYDDTSGIERIHERHRTGTSYEINADGSPKVEIIKDESYRLLSNKEQVQIQATIRYYNRWILYKLFINKSQTDDRSYDIQVGKGVAINIQVGVVMSIYTLLKARSI